MPGGRTFDIPELTRHLAANPLLGRRAALDLSASCSLALGFWFRSGRFIPGRRWVMASAPTATAMLHAGVLKKFGLYGLIRVALPLLPEAARSWMHVWRALPWATSFTCGLVAMRQKDFNLLIGNSSVAHMGFRFPGHRQPDAHRRHWHRDDHGRPRSSRRAHLRLERLPLQQTPNLDHGRNGRPAPASAIYWHGPDHGRFCGLRLAGLCELRR